MNTNNETSTAPHARRRHQRKLWILVALSSLIFGFMGAVLAVIGLARVHNPWWQQVVTDVLQRPTKNVSDQSVGVLGADDRAIVSMVERVNPSVVSIVISKDVPRLRRQSFGFPFFLFPFTPDDNSFDGSAPQNGNGGNSSTKQRVGEGSGFFVSSDGLIVTNRHVVSDDAASYTVITSDGKEHEATVIARDPVRDIALIKISDANTPALDLGVSTDIKVGQTVIAIGNSLGQFSNTVTKGIVSGLQRDLVAGDDSFGGNSEQLSNIIQTDAAINPGNSCGPLVNAAGQVVGVNVAIAQGAQNVGFAIPIDQVKKIIDQVRATGKISTPYLGVRYLIIDDEFQKANNLSVDHGALIARGDTLAAVAVIPGSPADKAGLMENDILLELNGQAIDTKHQLNDLLSNYDAGDAVTFKVLHRGDTKDVTITLGERK